jgi:putative iron-regulated protein
MIANALSIQNIYEGRAGTFDDPTRFIAPTSASLYALIRAADPALADLIRADIQAAVDAARAIPIPFDRAILPDNPTGRAAVLAFVERLEDATKRIVAGAAALGIQNLNTELPD